MRTVERDVAQLGDAGIRITIKRGPGGGFAMAGPRKPQPIKLDRGEIAVLITALVALGDYASATARLRAQSTDRRLPEPRSARHMSASTRR